MKREKRINVVGKKAPRVDPKEFANAIGAEPCRGVPDIARRAPNSFASQSAPKDEILTPEAIAAQWCPAADHPSGVHECNLLADLRRLVRDTRDRCATIAANVGKQAVDANVPDKNVVKNAADVIAGEIIRCL